MSTSTDVAPYTLTVFDGEPHLEGSCWLPDAQPMKLDREEQLSQDDATCALDTGEPSVLRTFVLTDLRDVEIEASEGAKLRILNDQGTTVVWADSKPLMPARYSSTLVPGTYYFLVGLADGAALAEMVQKPQARTHVVAGSRGRAESLAALEALAAAP